MTIVSKLAAALTSVFLFAGTAEATTPPETKSDAPAQEACKSAPAKPATGAAARDLARRLALGGTTPSSPPPAEACKPAAPAKPDTQKPAPKP